MYKFYIVTGNIHTYMLYVASLGAPDVVLHATSVGSFGINLAVNNN